MIEQLRRSDEAERRAAFDLLVQSYWQPIYAYLRLRWHLDAEDGEDMTQAFLAAAWEKEFFTGYDPVRARFRTFLRVCLDRFVQKQRKSGHAHKRGGRLVHVPLDFAAAEGMLDRASPEPDADSLFRQEFLRALFARVLGRFEAELRARGREIVYRVFERYDVAEPGARTYADLAVELDIPTTQVTNYLHAARRRFRELVLDELRAASESEAEYRVDVRELLGIDISTPAGHG
ncbi:MAG: RNA polymerase sigma factor [Longimicrobiales bacterium]